MLRFCGVFSSDSTLLKCAVAAAEAQLKKALNPTRNRLGLGYYSGDEVLLVRRPISQDAEIWSFLGSAVGNFALIGLDDAPSMQFRLETTPPYRFRNYLGVFSVGHISDPEFPEKVLFNLPDYLARDVKTRLPGDLLFHLFLSYLHDMGRLDARSLKVESLLDAMRSTFHLFPKLVRTGPAQPVAPLAGCVTNGEHLVAASQGYPLLVLDMKGISPCRLCSDQKITSSQDERRAEHPSVHTIALLMIGASDVSSGPAVAHNGQVVAVNAQGELIIRSI